MSAIARRVRFKERAGAAQGYRQCTALEAANAFSAGKVDLAVVRGDVGDLSQAQAVVVVSHVVVLIIAPPGSSIDSMRQPEGTHSRRGRRSSELQIVDVFDQGIWSRSREL